MSREAFATKLPPELVKTLDEVCERFGFRKNYIIETALREKLEDILDTHDLDESVKEATGFHSWKALKKELKL
ncbi:MAG: hypothetical protein A3I05_09860 [Deltaproteobacteria bacterium RIFCSPLOWO2_02_FULL_44_10]|nr:MAG: hypothetical protein A3C46_09325 [Deltaproteobacteria bacterium RIFCSPHIGHO2_02_FULL_44_16]OGQ44999.1 MAG: hypothetical protein A3I05_09860 [Deltaproteobacteria bacterium RIFCSPLOWO2_02_FULL_44_10]